MKLSATERRGTPGIRAPEILLRSNEQSGKIDIYAVGLILLSIILRSYPCFDPSNDAHALMYLIAIHGWASIRNVAHILRRSVFLMGCDFSNLESCNAGPNISAFVKLYMSEPLLTTHTFLYDDQILSFLDKLLCLDHNQRCTAKQALNHPFLKFLIYLF